jgi:anion-transporting  ArsA/GET3 family ATPase
VSEPRVVICAGGGGVGKTTTAAALALALARSGRSTLIVTIDPARRLAGAMGVPITHTMSRVPLAEARGNLLALMPDPRHSLRTFVEQLFENEPAGRDRVLANRLYVGLADAAAGVHELVAMNLVAHAATRGDIEVIVVDTAPSRHAVDFVTYPDRLASLLGGRTVAWLARLAARSGEGSATERPTASVLSWGAGYLEAVIARATGPTLVRDTANLFGDLALVRERFVALASRASRLLLGERAAYALVAAPTAAARDDVLYLAKRLEVLGHAPRAVVMNRADAAPAPWLATLVNTSAVPASVRDAASALADESASRTTAADTFAADLAKHLKGTALLRLPFVESPTPVGTVLGLSTAIERHLDGLLPS